MTTRQTRTEGEHDAKAAEDVIGPTTERPRGGAALSSRRLPGPTRGREPAGGPPVPATAPVEVGPDAP